MLEIDHVILGVRDLDLATRRMDARLRGGRRRPSSGSWHGEPPRADPAAWFGPPQYLELPGVVDRREAEACDFGRVLLRRMAAGDGLTRWCLQTDTLEVTAARLGLVPETTA